MVQATAGATVSTQAAALLATLGREIEVLARLAALGDEELEVVATGDLEAFLALLDVKEALVGRLHSLEARRSREAAALTEQLTEAAGDLPSLAGADVAASITEASGRLLAGLVNVSIANGAMATTIDRQLGAIDQEQGLMASLAGEDRYDGRGRSRHGRWGSAVELEA